MITASCYYGVGNHVAHVERFGTVAVAMKWSIISSAIVLFGIGTSKVAIIAFLLTVQGLTHRHLQVFLYFLAVTNLAFNTALPFVIVFQCQPPAGEWDMEIAKTAKCRPSSINTTFGEFTAGWNTLTDFALAVYPTILFWKVQMPRKIKIGTSCLMGVGIFATGCAAAKGWAIHLITTGVDDITYKSAPLWLLGMTELWVCLIVASIPPLWPLVKQYLLGGRTTNRYGSRNTPQQGGSIGLQTIGQAPARISKHPKDPDRSDSLERILDIEAEPRKGIRTTKNVAVQYEGGAGAPKGAIAVKRANSPVERNKSPIPIAALPRSTNWGKKESNASSEDSLDSLVHR